MTIFMHFGMQKTANTSLQRSFRAKGRWNGHAYTSSGRTRSNNIVQFSKTHDRATFLRKADRALVAKNARSGAGTVIVYSVNFPFLGMIERLHATGRPVRIVGYMRRPKSVMGSIFQERLKKRRIPPKDIAPLYPTCRRKFEIARRTHGVETEYWPIEPARMPDACVVRDFCDRLSIQFDPTDIRRENVDLSLPATRFLQALHKFTQRPDGVDSKEIGASVRRLSDPHDHDATALDWLRQRVGMESGDLRPDPRVVTPRPTWLRDNLDAAA